MKKWIREHTQDLIRSRWLTVREERFRTPDGAIVEPYYVLEYPDFITCVVIDNELNVIMLKHYRPASDTFVKEIPAGRVDDTDASPAETARREILEEIGYTGGELFHTGVTWHNPAMLTNQHFSYLALGGKMTEDNQGDATETFEMYRTTLPELLTDLRKHRDTAEYQSLHEASIYAAVETIKHLDHPYAVKLRPQLS